MIRCISCGQFMRPDIGCSWSQTWHYDMSGFPELDDIKYQCKKCTDKFGVPDTNCAYPERYSGIIKVIG